MKINVQNLGNKVTADSLAAIFSTYGKVQSVHLVSSEKIGESARGAQVLMPNKAEATTAIARLNGCFVDGSSLFITPVIPEKAPGRFGLLPAQTLAVLNKLKLSYTLKEQ